MIVWTKVAVGYDGQRLVVVVPYVVCLYHPEFAHSHVYRDRNAPSHRRHQNFACTQDWSDGAFGQPEVELGCLVVVVDQNGGRRSPRSWQ